MNSSFLKLAATFVIALGSTAAGLGGRPAHAAPQTWTFPTIPVQITGGGTHATLSGSFDYDYDTDAYSNIDVTVADSGVWGTVDFVHLAPFVPPPRARGNSFTFVNANHSLALNINLYSSMTDSDTLASIQSVVEAECLSFACSDQHQPLLDGWNLNTLFLKSSPRVPEPGSLAVIAVALTGLELVRRRKRAQLNFTRL